MSGRLLCRVDELPSPGSRRFEYPENPMGHTLLVVRVGEEIRAYINSCPHTGAPLDWLPGEFLDAENEEIVCSMHGARFRPGDGYCVWGPCAGKSLTPVGLAITHGEVRLAEPTGDNASELGQ